MISCISMRDYFASGMFDEDIRFNIAQADLFDASNSLQRYFKRKTGKTLAEQTRREETLYEAAKRFVDAWDSRVRKEQECMTAI